MGTTTAAADLKAAMHAAVLLAVPGSTAGPGPTPGSVQVAYGYPVNLRDDSILIMGVSTTQEWRTSNRAREETLQLEVIVSAWRVSKNSQYDADQAAYSYLELVDRYCRVTDPTLVGAGAAVGLIREIVCTATESDGFTRMEWRQSGRGCEIQATFTAHARISG